MGSWKLVWILFMFCHMPVFVRGGISVHFKSGPHLSVAVGETLVLEAEVQKSPEDRIDMVTWEFERGNDKIRISVHVFEDRLSFEKDNSLLRITDIMEKDFGIYKVTVTDSNGQQKQASIVVRRIEEPPNALITPVLECSVDNSDVAQWDRPQFVWLVDDVEVTNQTALLANGSRLNISQVKGDNYTCVVTSSLGKSTARYETPKHHIRQESQACSHHHWGLSVVGIAIAILLCVAGCIFIRRKCHSEPTTDGSNE